MISALSHYGRGGWPSKQNLTNPLLSIKAKWGHWDNRQGWGPSSRNHFADIIYGWSKREEVVNFGASNVTTTAEEEFLSFSFYHGSMVDVLHFKAELAGFVGRMDG